MERRRRRRRRRIQGSSDRPKPLSIDMLKKQRHKNAKSKRVASVRLDLDDPGGFNNSGFNRKQLFWKVLAMVLVLSAISAVLYDYGFGKLGTQISDFVTSIGKGVQETANPTSPNNNDNTLAAMDELAGLRGTDVPADVNTNSVFYPDGNSESVSRIQLAMDTAKVGLVSQSMTLLDEAKELDPEITSLDYIRATIYVEAEEPDQARKYFELAKESKETFFLAHLKLANLEFEQENYAASAQNYAVARSLKPQDQEIASSYSDALRMNQQFQEGLFEAQAAHRMNPEIRALEVTAKLAAIQAGAFQPPPELLESINSTEINSAASPFEMVIAAGWAKSQGDLEKVEQYWDNILTHAESMTSLKSLKEDPLFVLRSPEPVPPGETTSILPELPATLATIEEISESSSEIGDEIPEPEIDFNISLKAPEQLNPGFLNLSADPQPENESP
ncbi:MAG: hypothetical protein AAF571_00685 [Verrucomicrobiota bacterium]